MKEREIPRADWSNYFDEFSRQHEGWLVSVAVIDTDLLQRSAADVESAPRPHVLSSCVPLRGILGEQHGDDFDLSVIVGAGPGRLTHSIFHPVRAFEQLEDGAHGGLRIDAASGSTVLVRFRTAVLPEALDGVSGMHR